MHEPRQTGREPDEACVERLRLLADATRLSIVQMLRSGPRPVKEINEQLEIEANLLSHHLKVLREGGLLTAERRGKSVFYSLADGVSDTEGQDCIDLGCCKLSF